MDEIEFDGWDFMGHGHIRLYDDEDLTQIDVAEIEDDDNIPHRYSDMLRPVTEHDWAGTTTISGSEPSRYLERGERSRSRVRREPHGKSAEETEGGDLKTCDGRDR